MNKTLAAAVLVSCVACGVPKDQFAAVQRDAQESREKLQAESERVTAAEKKIRDLQQSLATAQQQLGAAQEQVGSLKATNAQLNHDKAALSAKVEQNEQLTLSLLRLVRDSGGHAGTPQAAPHPSTSSAPLPATRQAPSAPEKQAPVIKATQPVGTDS